MTYFNNAKFDEDERRNIAFQSVIAVRESISMAKKAPQPITYEQTLDLIHDLDPEIYRQVTSLLKNKNESDTVKYYKEKSEALSVAPTKLIDEDIIENEKLLERGSETKFIRRRIFELNSAKKHFEDRRVSEHKVLNQDFYLADRKIKVEHPLYSNESYKDYRISENRILRLRLLHPDNDEAILGTDLIYEIFDLKNNKVRFVHLQYKMWNTKNELYLSDSRMFGQIDKMESNICKAGFCGDDDGSRHPKHYRLPYCAGFLRPTNKLQDSDSKLVSTGMHIPLCEIKKIKETETKLTKLNIVNRAISNQIFEELFNNNIIGSRWLWIKELDEFYQNKGLNSITDSIRVHAQEVIDET